MRACKNFEDEKRDRGYRSVSREVLFYKDPGTNKILCMWVNPWTGEELEVMQVANDPVYMRWPSYAYSKDGEGGTFNATIVGNRGFTTGEAPLGNHECFISSHTQGLTKNGPLRGGSGRPFHLDAQPSRRLNGEEITPESLD